MTDIKASADGQRSPKLKVAADMLRQQQQLSTALPLGFLNETLQRNVQSERLMKGLLIYIPFLIVFIFFFVAQRSVESEYFYAQALRDLMHGEELPPTSPVPGADQSEIRYYLKTYDEIRHERDWYDYVQQVLAPQMFAPTAQASLLRPVLGHVYPVGSLRIRAKHVTNTSCSPNRHMFPTDNETEFPRPCHGKFSEGDEFKGPLGRGDVWWEHSDAGCDGDNGRWGKITGHLATYNCGGFVLDLPLTTSLEDAIAAFVRLQQGGFAFSLSLRFIAVEMNLYNVVLDSFVSVRLFCEVSEGGGWVPQQRFRPFRVSDNNKGWIVYTAFFACFIVYFWAKMVRETVRHFRMHGRILSYYFNVWNFLELGKNIALVVLFVVYYIWWTKSDRFAFRFPTLRSAAEDEGVVRFAANEPYNLDLNTIAEVYQLGQYFGALSTVLLFLEILKFLRLNNRLNILSRTLESAAGSIIGVLLMFCWVVLSYTIAGYTIYGPALYNFRSVDESFASLFRLLMGSFDYPAMREEHRALTFMFFWSFVIIGLFVLLNFIIAVIMNSFGTESERQRPVPLSTAVGDWLGRLRRTWKSKGFTGLVVEYVTTSSSVRVEEYVATYMTTLTLAKEFDALNLSMDEDQIAREIAALSIRRSDLGSLVPRTELEDIGEQRVDALWCDVVAEYENTTLADDAARVKRLKDGVFHAAVEGVTRVLTKHQRRLFGYSAAGAEDDGDGEGSSCGGSQRVSRASSFRGGGIRRGSSRRRGSINNSFAVADFESESTHIRGQAISLQSGGRATGASDIVEEINSRVAFVETRFSKMNSVLDIVEENLKKLRKQL